MVTTRGHGEDELEQLGEKGKESTKQQGQIAKKPKTVPLQQADQELEEGLEQQFSKKRELAGEAGWVEGEQNKRAAGIEEEDEEAYKGGRGRGGGGRGRGGGGRGTAEMGGQKGRVAQGGEEEEEEEEEEPEIEEEEEEEQATKGKRKAPAAKGKGAVAKGKVAAGGGKGALGLQVGEPAPDFVLKNQDGETVSLKDFQGKHVALYFYNKDDTPVVTKGGMAFNKAVPEFEKLGIPLLFIGPDGVQSHKRFQEKAGLQFPLLSDNKKEVAHKFHNLKGRNVARTTVMIDPEGKVMKVWADIPENKVETNPFEALQWTKQQLEA